MSTDSAIISTTKPAIEFKSSTFTVPSLLLHSDDLMDIAEILQQKIRQAPDFFRNSPVLLDIHSLPESEKKIDISLLIKLVRDNKLIPIAIRGGNPEQNKAALRLGVPVQSAQHTGENSANVNKPVIAPKPVVESKLAAAGSSETNPESLPTTMITTPVRSGQRIYAPGDLVVLAQVSAGAEIMAEGNIHVYNSLRGRALAGVLGNTTSRIFCFDLQAELISIAGNYKVNDDLDKSMQHKPVQIYLQDQALIIKELSQHHFGG